MTSGDNSFIALSKCIRNFGCLQLRENEGSFIPSSRSMNVLYRRLRSPHDRMFREHGTLRIIYSQNIVTEKTVPEESILVPPEGQLSFSWPIEH